MSFQIDEAMQVAIGNHQAGRLADAETIYRQVLSLQPGHPKALHLLGVLAAQVGRPELAAELIRRAVATDPHDAVAYNDLGNALQTVGRLDHAVAAYLQAILLRTDYPEARSNLGNALQAQGKLDEAIAAYHEAIRSKPEYAEAHFNLAIALEKTGALDKAIASYREAIRWNPNSAAAHCNLGNALQVQRSFTEAIASYREAVRLDPKFVTAYFNLGTTLQETGQTSDAIAALRSAVLLEPHHPGALNNLGNALQSNGHLEEAIGIYRTVLAIDGSYAGAHNNLGNALQANGQLSKAMEAYREALRLEPDYAEAHNNLGHALNALGRTDDAIACYERSLKIRPDYADAWNNLGNTLQVIGRLDGAIAAYDKTIRIKPDHAQAHYNMGLALEANGRLDDAVNAYLEAIRIEPDYANAYNNLGNCHKDRARADLAIECYRKALEIEPEAADVHSNLVFAMCFHPGSSAAGILAESLEWNRRHAKPVMRMDRTDAGGPPSRRLRIGYVSSDLRRHVVGYNLLPLLREHDRTEFEIFCYAASVKRDEVTEQLGSFCDQWRDIADLSDQQAAALMAADGIDILVDLALHTAHNRLLIFARKPAPVQVSYLGYCGTTGLEAIDYRLSDPFLDPEGVDLSEYSETTIRLPRSYWCYQPAGEAPEEIATASPPGENITFGCLNNFAKVSAESLDLWCEILRSLPDSSLLLQAPPGTCREAVRKRFLDHSVAPERVEFVGRQKWSDYLRTLRRIDVALDPFPYGGGITTCDALWMGVPVVTLSGRTAVGRGGKSILSNIGLPELVAETPEEYVAAAAALAANPARRSALRKDLRELMERSALRGAKLFARDVEDAYRQMWFRHCGANPVPENH